MIRLLKIELLKIKSFRPFLLIVGAYLFFVPFTFISTYKVLSFNSIPFLPTSNQYFGFPDVYGYITYIMGWWTLFLSVLVIMITYNEINYKTERQNIIDGLSRKEFFLGKLYLFTGLSFAALAFAFLIALISGIISKDMSEVFSGIVQLLAFFIQSMSYFSLAFFLIVLIRRATVAIIVFMFLLFLEHFYTYQLGDVMAQYFFVNAFSDLTQFPLVTKFMTLENIDDVNFKMPYNLPQSIRLIVATIYTTIFFWGSYLLIKKRDL